MEPWTIGNRAESEPPSSLRRSKYRYAEFAHRTVRRMALSAATGRPVNVEPLVVMHGHARMSGWLWHHPAGVRVLPSRVVTWWLWLPARSVLSAEEAEALYAAACDPGTWRSV